MDFITIIFDSKIEYELLKLQASSYRFVDYSIINKIIILFNDNNILNEKFEQFFHNELFFCYPEKLRSLIQIIYLKDLDLNYDYSNWYTQQVCKIIISKKVSSKYYVILDSKNHFIKNITYEYFFKYNKPILYYNMQGGELLNFYNNCLDYFNVKCPNKKNHHPNYKIQTTTPFTFITEECLNMINYIEEKEENKFDIFFIKSQKYTEFYLYFSYLIHKNNLELYNYNNNLMPVLTIGPQDPKQTFYNTWEHKLSIIKYTDIYIIALHRLSIYVLDLPYKENLFNFYKNIYNENELNIIKNII